MRTYPSKMMTDDDYNLRQLELRQQIASLEEQKIKISNRLLALKQQKEELRVQHSLNRLKNKSDTSAWIEEFSWTKSVKDILKNTFKFDGFRSNQLAAINATLSKKDVLLIMPTGGGKSLVYQLPCVVTGNLSVVVSPLLSLIEDQLMALQKLGIPSATINSNTPKEDKKAIYTKIDNNKLRLIFVTPEWIAKTKVFLNHLTKIHKEGKLARIVIDEVHCCSQWGHDFRPDYMSLSLLKKQFPGVPILGLTATASASVLVDIQKILEIPESVVITSPYNRPNLFYQTENKPEGKSECTEYLSKLLQSDSMVGKSGIIYAGTQKECDELATDLRKKGLSVAPYHANLENSVKSKIHKKWTENYYQVVIATIAFGMGIDKPDVRFVIHYTVPKAIEGLYQETGRAGRDGQFAKCILMFNLTDWLRVFANTRSVREENITMNILKYCISVGMCRRKMISEYFDDDWRLSDCQKMCDHCESAKDIKTYNIAKCTDDIFKLIEAATAAEVNLTLKKLLDIWFHLGPKNMQLNKRPAPSFTKQQAEFIIAFLISKEYLCVRRGYSLVSTIPYLDTNSKFQDGKKIEKVLMQYPRLIRGVSQVDTVQNSSLTESNYPNKKRKTEDED